MDDAQFEVKFLAPANTSEAKIMEALRAFDAYDFAIEVLELEVNEPETHRRGKLKLQPPLPKRVNYESPRRRD